MALDKFAKYSQALDEIESDELVFIEDVCVNLAISKPTFYKWFPTDSEEYETIFQALEKNKVLEKRKIRKTWSASGKFPETVALYKLIGTKDDRERLSTHRIDHSTLGDKLPEMKSFDVSKMSNELLEELMKIDGAKENAEEDEF